MRSTTIERMLARGLHDELTQINNRVTEISEALAVDYFAPETTMRAGST